MSCVGTVWSYGLDYTVLGYMYAPRRTKVNFSASGHATILKLYLEDSAETKKRG
ncbi:MAG: hypothetical protein ACQEXV_16570 [Bacillota bacterium]